MCGICYYNGCNHTNEEILEYFTKIQHRGPDSSGYKIINNQFFGCHRLAVINLEPEGNQPLELDGNVLICNGQIYNYKELAEEHDIKMEKVRTDVDIILHLYVKGIPIMKICNMLDGVFAFVLYDTSQNRHFVARDPVGIRPLFWSCTEEGNLDVVCSEIKGMKTSNKINVFPPSHLYDSHGDLTKYFDFEQPEKTEIEEKERELVKLTFQTSTLSKYYTIYEDEMEELEKYIKKLIQKNH